MTAVGTLLPRANAAACPQLAKVDFACFLNGHELVAETAAWREFANKALKVEPTPCTHPSRDQQRFHTERISPSGNELGAVF
jgi:hypothetical protein